MDAAKAANNICVRYIPCAFYRKYTIEGVQKL